MISSTDFDFFLNNGFIEGLSNGVSMNILLTKFGNRNWYAKHIENNGLICGIIKVGFIEFHIYNEKFFGVSYRPDLPFCINDFKGVDIPWIYENIEVSKVEGHLNAREIGYKKYMVSGPANSFKAAGGVFSLDDGEQTIIDTCSGVTFMFVKNDKTGNLKAQQICKYYDINKEEIN
jgi:hypothetical protein